MSECLMKKNILSYLFFQGDFAGKIKKKHVTGSFLYVTYHKYRNIETVFYCFISQRRGIRAQIMGRLFFLGQL